jgi:quinolinate synthase
MEQLIEEIKALKAQRNALILAHNYVRPELQDLADFTGDSLELSIKARDAKAPLMVFCGVRFMAETAKLLSPDSTVLLPNPDADCPMARMADGEQVKAWRSEFPDAVFAAYVNTTAETKAQVDICCTSGNAEKVVRSLEGQKIVFLPDRNLGGNINNILGTEMSLWNGCCPVHDQVTPEMLKGAREFFPDAAIIIHPECKAECVAEADAALSTAGMLKFVKECDKKTIVVATESGLLHRLKKENPEKRFIPLAPEILCPDMKKITLEDLRDALKFNQHEITLAPEIMEKAVKPIEKMLAL